MMTKFVDIVTGARLLGKGKIRREGDCTPKSPEQDFSKQSKKISLLKIVRIWKECETSLDIEQTHLNKRVCARAKRNLKSNTLHNEIH